MRQRAAAVSAAADREETVGLSASITEGTAILVDDETTTIGGLPIAVVDRASAAESLCRVALARRGKGGRAYYVTSANGQVLAMCDRDPAVRDLFLAADVIHADGMPMVFVSRLLGRRALPERVATTDLFDDVMALSARHGIRSYLLGARPEINAAALAAVRRRYPDIPEPLGHHGYFDASEEDDVVAEIAEAAPDILWIGLGVPKEQQFSLRHRDRLSSVGVIKTSGGLFDFVAGLHRRAPLLLQKMGLEWAWRATLEPHRLGVRYFDTNFTALRLLLTRTR